LHRAAHDRVAEQRDIDHDADAQRRGNDADHGRIFPDDARKRIVERLEHRGENMIAEIHARLMVLGLGFYWLS
jgi:predicted flavoprotein YhiN